MDTTEKCVVEKTWQELLKSTPRLSSFEMQRHQELPLVLDDARVTPASLKINNTHCAMHEL
jgi:hypothetical protein